MPVPPAPHIGGQRDLPDTPPPLGARPEPESSPEPMAEQRDSVDMFAPEAPFRPRRNPAKRWTIAAAAAAVLLLGGMGAMTEENYGPQFMAPLVCYLASDAAAHITGQTFGVDVNHLYIYKSYVRSNFFSFVRRNCGKKCWGHFINQQRLAWHNHRRLTISIENDRVLIGYVLDDVAVKNSWA